MNRDDRRQIGQMVQEGRRVLQEEFDQLLRLHGLFPDRKVDVPQERHETRVLLEEALTREGADYGAARGRYIKHAAFTFLNRVMALRLAEAHRLITETILPRSEYGDRSRRERDLADVDASLAVAPERLANAALNEASREMGAHIPLLFREDDPYALLLPGLPAYREVREALAQVPEHLWLEFETLGWTYQYFNSAERKEIRRRLRRNPQPDDIPPLNQFYTVGWIVKALVHNTVGRLWLEAHPESALKPYVDYLVPTNTGFQPPVRSLSVSDFKVLDPACGSGHFLLGAFDLLLEMWREEHPDLPAWEIPALILGRNLYGVDIDLRACQIAAAALYLKARTAFEQLKDDSPDARFEPRRLNVVCADIRFTDSERRQGFLERFADQPAIRRIVEETLEACELAFEIGSLLRIRQPFERLFAQRTAKPEELRERVEQLSFLRPLVEQLSLGDIPVPVPKRLTVEEIVSCIGKFVRQASEAQDMGSLLFGWDAEQAVHLIDVLTDHYDVVLMNPPYGDMPQNCKQYARHHYPRTRNDYYAAFIEQSIELCRHGGYVGALTGRTFMFLKSFGKLREGILRREALPEVVWDLGPKVLDEASARYAAFALRKRYENDGVHWAEHPVTFFRLTNWDWDEKRLKFEDGLSEITSEQGDTNSRSIG